MTYDFILAADPSGNYNEGKGTTGWCVFETAKDAVTLAGSFTAKAYKTMEDYWQAHIDLINKFFERYGKRLIVVIEDYILYESRAASQINSRMETCKVIGVVQHYCHEHKIPYTMQTASLVKKRWADHILEYKHYLTRHGNDFYLPHTKTKLDRHAKDAVRHAVHYSNFKNKGD